VERHCRDAGRLIHGYDVVDVAELWKTATVDIPALSEQIRKIQPAEFGVP
jgi:uncharacterized protein with HEPN domain